MALYNKVACGGTFDHFHKGHEAFLSNVLARGKEVIVGVTSDAYISTQKNTPAKDQIESFNRRKKAVEQYVASASAKSKTTIVQIDDIYGPTVSFKNDFDVLVVSSESAKGAEKINERRNSLGLLSLPVIKTSLVLAEDGRPISSSRIRRGEINRKGILYVRPSWEKQGLALTKTAREICKKPLGKVFTSFKNNFLSPLFTVGDITTFTAVSENAHISIAVVDFLVERKTRFSSLEELGIQKEISVLHATNPAGTISPNLFQAVNRAIDAFYMEEKVVIKVDGEEDLAVLPLLLKSPLGVVIVYGQPGIGMVEVVVSEKSKDHALAIVLGLPTLTTGY